MTRAKLANISLQRRDLLRSSTSILHLLKRYSDQLKILWLFNATFLVLTWLSFKRNHVEHSLNPLDACFDHEYIFN